MKKLPGQSDKVESHRPENGIYKKLGVRFRGSELYLVFQAIRRDGGLRFDVQFGTQAVPRQSMQWLPVGPGANQGMRKYFMLRYSRRACVALFTITLLAANEAAFGASQRAVIRAKEKVEPALVHVRPVKEVFRRGQRREVAVTGSGFIISPDGYVVTNAHVAGKESNFVKCVLYNREEVEAEIVGVDEYTDIAVLKLKTDRTDLPHVELGRSQDVQSGITVLALGSPHGLSRSVSMGIVSVTDRNLENFGSGVAPYNNWIQTDAAINPGNSGGPLVDLSGRVIGINTRKLTGADNIGFAIPIDVAREVIDELLAYGQVTRSTIGVTFQEMRSTTDDPTRPGVVIGDVSPISPAFQAGLQPGDILLAVNGTPTNARFTEDLPAVRKLVADLPVNSEAELTVQRGGETRTVTVTTEALTEVDGDEVEFEEWGCTIGELTPNIRRSARLAADSGGVFISGVRPGGLAALSGLLPNDIILEFDEVPVEGLPAFSDAYHHAIGNQQRLVLLTIKRGALTLFKMVKQQTGEEQE